MEQSNAKGQLESLPRTEDDFGGTDGGSVYDPEAAESQAERSPLKRPRARQVIELSTQRCRVKVDVVKL